MSPFLFFSCTIKIGLLKIMPVQKFKVEITYEIDTTERADEKTVEEITESVVYKIYKLGYGANLIWNLNQASIKIRVKKR